VLLFDLLAALNFANVFYCQRFLKIKNVWKIKKRLKRIKVTKIKKNVENVFFYIYGAGDEG